MIRVGTGEFKLETEMDVKEPKGDIAAFHQCNVSSLANYFGYCEVFSMFIL